MLSAHSKHLKHEPYRLMHSLASKQTRWKPLRLPSQPNAWTAYRQVHHVICAPSQNQLIAHQWSVRRAWRQHALAKGISHRHAIYRCLVLFASTICSLQMSSDKKLQVPVLTFLLGSGYSQSSANSTICRQTALPEPRSSVWDPSQWHFACSFKVVCKFCYGSYRKFLSRSQNHTIFRISGCARAARYK